MEIDVSHFYPRVISVYTFKNLLIVQGYYSEDSVWWRGSDRGYIRAYALPCNTLINTLKVNIKNNGILCIRAKKGTKRYHIFNFITGNLYRKKKLQYRSTYCFLLTPIGVSCIFAVIGIISKIIWQF